MAGSDLPETAERRYTLEEAKVELMRQDCAKYGHVFQVLLVFGTNEPRGLICDRCGSGWFGGTN